MISFREAISLVLKHAGSPRPEEVELAGAAGRVLFDDVLCDMDFPPFHRVCMDGYAARREDLEGAMQVVDVVAAGQKRRHALSPGQCVKIMTGAELPEGADVVFQVELSEELPGGKVRFTGTRTADNIARRGEDLLAGDRVLTAGTLLLPQHIAVLAAVGKIRPRVAARPEVGILATGDELVEPGQIPNRGQIRNSNSAQLVAQVTRAGGTAHYLGVVGDSVSELERAIAAGVQHHDVLLMTGGVSMGDFDHVPACLEGQGVRILFDSVAIKPGKPTTFGASGSKVVFGLPGNPVSSFVAFELLVRPFLEARAGVRRRVCSVAARLGESLGRKHAERDEWIPVRLEEGGMVRVLPFHGSGHFAALVDADGLVMIPAGQMELEAGTEVGVLLI